MVPKLNTMYWNEAHFPNVQREIRITFCTEQILFVYIILNTDHWWITHINRLNLINLQIVSLLNYDISLDYIHIVFSLIHNHNSNGCNSQFYTFAAFEIAVYIQFTNIFVGVIIVFIMAQKNNPQLAVISATDFWNKIYTNITLIKLKYYVFVMWIYFSLMNKWDATGILYVLAIVA